MPSAETTPGRTTRTGLSRIPAWTLGVAAAIAAGGIALAILDSPWHLLLGAAGAAGLVACGMAGRRRLTILGGEINAAAATAERARSAAASAANAHAARWQAIVDTATEGIVTIDCVGRIENVNGAAVRLFGYSSEELVGQNVRMLMPAPFSDEHDGYLKRYRETGERRIIGIGREVVGRRKDGSLFPIDLSVGEGRVDDQQFFTAVIRDITERKQMQSKLAQTERLAAVGELAAGVAHEVNNPINTIINCAQLIADGDETQENCQVIIEEGQRIAEIVKDLLQFARDDQDRAQPTNLPDVIERTLRLIGESFKRHGIHLRVAVPDDLPQVLARPQQIQQVLLNLLMNAKDALLGHPGSARTVQLTSTVGDNGVELAIADNGPGIPTDQREQVFDPFYTKRSGGLGLGLAIARQIAAAHHGEITVGVSAMQGAEFRLRLPNLKEAT